MGFWGEGVWCYRHHRLCLLLYLLGTQVLLWFHESSVSLRNTKPSNCSHIWRTGNFSLASGRWRTYLMIIIYDAEFLINHWSLEFLLEIGSFTWCAEPRNHHNLYLCLLQWTIMMLIQITVTYLYLNCSLGQTGSSARFSKRACTQSYLKHYIQIKVLYRISKS